MEQITEKILLFDTAAGEMEAAYEAFCHDQGIGFISVKESEYDMPLGLVAYGDGEQKEPYIRKEKGKLLEGSMMLLAGFTRARLVQVIDDMKKASLPHIPLKAMMTEHNAVWTSVDLYENLLEEHMMIQKNLQKKEEKRE